MVKGGPEYGNASRYRRAARALLRRVRRGISGDPQDRLQALLDEKDAREWHLVGVAGGLEGGGMILFWDTERPSFGRRSR